MGSAAVGLAAPAHGQDLSGTWQGVEVTPPRVGSWSAQLVLRAGPGNTVSGELYQRSDARPDFTGDFEMRGTQAGRALSLIHARIISQRASEGGFWCQGSLALTYNPADESLSGRATYQPRGDCNSGLFTLYRIRLKSAPAVPAGAESTLHVSGREVEWFADSARQHKLASGNSFRVKLQKTTTFYVTQGYYATSRSRPVPLTVRVLPAAPKPAPRRAPPAVARPSAAPVVLPTVLFRTATAVLKPESGPALDQLAATLRARPTLRLRIAGHTDRIGEAAKNLVLSEQRARTVQAYLVQAGTAAARLQTVGYGDTHLLYPTPDARNQRVEIEELR
ncbi:OmpA family protein [Hymenobacter properus]|uniref:OmpA family protein n=1 Tax=Hymenobacter properus TaxID=2791026 RepID=A0A931FIB7_9BACT|nr:OmpA family protein [Hymenobacter properus]MBF9140608.1 OmpA family protein [Hymenobacter properus]MBR7719416.1 OmpA family protein [Microvirga sp. SRT04]